MIESLPGALGWDFLSGTFLESCLFVASARASALHSVLGGESACGIWCTVLCCGSHRTRTSGRLKMSLFFQLLVHV